jgi:hypothetical protein
MSDRSANNITLNGLVNNIILDKSTNIIPHLMIGKQNNTSAVKP